MEWALSAKATLKWRPLLEVRQYYGFLQDCLLLNLTVVPALILGFNVSSTKQIAALAKSKDVHLLSHNIIYKLLDALKVKQ